MSEWRTFRIAANGMVKDFYAPDLDSAFRMARAWQPTATQWTCLRSVAGDTR